MVGVGLVDSFEDVLGRGVRGSGEKNEFDAWNETRHRQSKNEEAAKVLEEHRSNCESVARGRTATHRWEFADRSF